jgi:hypothetical protein
VYGEAQPIFFAKIPAFSGGVRSCVVSMNNESPAIDLRAERKKFCEIINTTVLDIKCVAFWKRADLTQRLANVPSRVEHNNCLLDIVSATR